MARSAPRRKRPAPASRPRSRPRRPAPRRATKPAPRASRPSGFVGRDASPVLAVYPKKDPALSVRGPPKPAAPSAVPPSNPSPSPPTPVAPATAAPTPPSTPPPGLITLDRPFDLDDFSRQLGESSIRVTVPRENLAELLARVSEFMNFGIYVYEFSVRPAAGDMLKSFEVELQRVDFSAAERRWRPFRDRGRADTPFGPGGGPG